MRRGVLGDRVDRTGSRSARVCGACAALAWRHRDPSRSVRCERASRHTTRKRSPSPSGAGCAPSSPTATSASGNFIVTQGRVSRRKNISSRRRPCISSALSCRRGSRQVKRKRPREEPNRSWRRAGGRPRPSPASLPHSGEAAPAARSRITGSARSRYSALTRPTSSSFDELLIATGSRRASGRTSSPEPRAD